MIRIQFLSFRFVCALALSLGVAQAQGPDSTIVLDAPVDSVSVPVPLPPVSGLRQVAMLQPSTWPFLIQQVEMNTGSIFALYTGDGPGGIIRISSLKEWAKDSSHGSIRFTWPVGAERFWIRPSHLRVYGNRLAIFFQARDERQILGSWISWIDLSWLKNGRDFHFVVRKEAGGGFEARFQKVHADAIESWAVDEDHSLPMVIATPGSVTDVGSYSFIANDSEFTAVEFMEGQAPRTVAPMQWRQGLPDRFLTSKCELIGETIVSNGIAFLASRCGIVRLNLENPMQPRSMPWLKVLELPALGMDATEDRLIVTSGENQVSVFDLSKPEDPTLLRTLQTKAQVLDVAADSFGIYAGTNKGLEVFGPGDSEEKSIATLAKDEEIFSVNRVYSAPDYLLVRTRNRWHRLFHSGRGR